MDFRFLLLISIAYISSSCKDDNVNSDSVIVAQNTLKRDSTILDSLLNKKDKFFLDYSYGLTSQQYNLICLQLVKEKKIIKNYDEKENYVLEFIFDNKVAQGILKPEFRNDSLLFISFSLNIDLSKENSSDVSKLYLDKYPNLKLISSKTSPKRYDEDLWKGKTWKDIENQSDTKKGILEGYLIEEKYNLNEPNKNIGLIIKKDIKVHERKSHTGWYQADKYSKGFYTEIYDTTKNGKWIWIKTNRANVQADIYYYSDQYILELQNNVLNQKFHDSQREEFNKKEIENKKRIIKDNI